MENDGGNRCGGGGGAHSVFYRAGGEGVEEVGVGARPAATAISMAAILESEAGATRERNRRGGAGVARLGR
jgi:hypothetical protein